jgi:DNA-binding IclR family transcriptional regulator
VALGHRLPLLPPFGQVFLAWSSAGTVDRWIARGLGERHEHLDRAHLLDALDQVAARGYAVNLSTPAIDRLKDTLSELTRHPRDQDLRARLPELVCALGDDYELLDEQPDRRYDVEMVSAPVFAADGSVTFAITMTGLAHRTGQEITQVAEQVAGAGLFVTRQIGGRMPAWVPGRRSA